MRRLALVLLPLLAGCSSLRYDSDPVGVVGTVWVAGPRIDRTHDELDRAVVASDIRTAAIEELRKRGIALAQEEASADLVITPAIDDFFLGADAVRLLGWHPAGMDSSDPYFAARLELRPKGHGVNGTRRHDTVDAGGFTKDEARRLRTAALVRVIARFVADTAEDFRVKKDDR